MTENGAKPKRRPLAGRTLQGVAVLLLMAFIFALFFLLYIGWEFWTQSPAIVLTSPFWIFIFIVGWWKLPCEFIFNWGLRLNSISADEILAHDSRPPVLYLRTFATDRKVGREEKALAQMLESVGPLVSLGRPGELAPGLGSHRLYIGNEDWRPLVSKLLSNASFVVVLAGSSASLGWEIKECMLRLTPSQLLLLIPDSAKAFGEFKALIETQAGLTLTVDSNYFGRAKKLDLIDFAIGNLLLRRDASNLIGFVNFSYNWQPQFQPFYELDERPIYAQRWDLRMRFVLERALKRNINKATGFELDETFSKVAQIGNWVRYVIIPLMILGGLKSCTG